VTRRRPASRALLGAGLVAAAVALTGCASTLDTVHENDYFKRAGDGMLRVQTPYANKNAPAGAIYPDSCKSPPSMMGAPDGC
jgi:hypothetical protein